MTRKQLRKKGTEQESIKEIDSAAESYVDARDKRINLTDREPEAKEALISVMRAHNVAVYRDENADPQLIVTLTPGDDKVTVTRAKDEDDEREDSGD